MFWPPIWSLHQDCGKCLSFDAYYNMNLQFSLQKGWSSVSYRRCEGLELIANGDHVSADCPQF